MQLDKLRKYLEKKHHCEIFADLDLYLELPVNQLYKDLSRIKKDSYPDNYRIFYYTLSPANSDLIQHWQKTLAQLQIPNFFVKLISNQQHNTLFLKQAAEQFTSDQEPIELIVCSDLIHNITKQKTNFIIPDTVCINAWTNVFVDNAGYTKPCCIFQGSNISTVEKTTLVDTLNSDSMKKLRQEMLSGIKPKECNQCWIEEENKKISKRLQDNYRFRGIAGDIDWNQIDNIDPATLNIKLGNICNLSCRICEPKQSSSFDHEVKHNTILEKFYKPNIYNNKWVQDEHGLFWQSMKDSKDSLKVIQFEGAEPLLVKQHFKILDYYVAQGIAQNICLHYNTNASIFPETKFEIFEKFQQVEFTLSIDNLDKKFEYERFGVSWKTVDSNIQKFACLDKSKFTVNVNTTVSALNIMDTYNLFQYFNNAGIPIDFNILYTPNDMSIAVLTDETKKYILAKFDSIPNNEFRQKIEPVLTYMITTKLDLLQRFIDRNQVLDNSRNQSFSDTYPELYNFIRKHHGNQTF